MLYVAKLDCLVSAQIIKYMSNSLDSYCSATKQMLLNQQLYCLPSLQVDTRTERPEKLTCSTIQPRSTSQDQVLKNKDQEKRDEWGRRNFFTLETFPLHLLNLSLVNVLKQWNKWLEKKTNEGEVDDDDYQWLAGSLGIPQPDKRATLLYPQITITQLCHVMMWMITMMMIVTALTMTAIFVLPYFDRSSQSIYAGRCSLWTHEGYSQTREAAVVKDGQSQNLTEKITFFMEICLEWLYMRY